ncbi:MAG TPA: hypothetical protein VHX88_04665 [Solirubrobacteraceae bacterium]|nr:hypothetical protein [Solirubrobacteraceae bacterium]
MDRFFTLLGGALANEEIAERVGDSGLVVRVFITDLPDDAITLRLDRTPPSVHRGAHEATVDVRLELPSSAVEQVILEPGYLPMEILAGRVRFSGPVRKLLRVLPILRAGARAARRPAA